MWAPVPSRRSRRPSKPKEQRTDKMTIHSQLARAAECSAPRISDSDVAYVHLLHDILIDHPVGSDGVGTRTTRHGYEVNSETYVPTRTFRNRRKAVCRNDHDVVLKRRWKMETKGFARGERQRHEVGKEAAGPVTLLRWSTGRDAVDRISRSTAIHSEKGLIVPHGVGWSTIGAASEIPSPL